MVLVFANQKGGVGKTTLTFNVGHALAAKGHRVLLVDMDPQGSLTQCCGYNDIPDEVPSMFEVMRQIVDLEDIVITCSDDYPLFLAPSDLYLAAAETEIQSAIARELILKKAIDKVRGMFDFILIDAPPSLGTLSYNALSASDLLIIPCTPDFVSYKGLSLVLNSVRVVTENLNSNLEIMGIVITKFKQTTHAKEVLDSIQERGYPVLSVVSDTVKVQDATMAGLPMFSYDPSHKVSEQINELVEVILNEQKADVI